MDKVSKVKVKSKKKVKLGNICKNLGLEMLFELVNYAWRQRNNGGHFSSPRKIGRLIHLFVELKRYEYFVAYSYRMKNRVVEIGPGAWPRIPESMCPALFLTW